MKRPSYSKGFSLVELLMLIVVLSIVTAGLVRMFAQLSQGVSLSHDIQVANQLAQECSEYLLGQRRQQGYAMNGVSDCSVLNTFNGQAQPNVTLIDPYVNLACPVAECKLFQINAQYGAASAKASLMFAPY